MSAYAKTGLIVIWDAHLAHIRGTKYLDSALAVCQEGIQWLPKMHAT